MNQLTGTIKIIGDTAEYGSNNFQKREFILTTDEKYPQDVKLDLYQKDCGLLDNYNIGDSVEATFNVKGNEYKDRYYVNLQAWRLQAAHGAHSTTEPPEEMALEEPPAPKKKSGRPKKNPEPIEETTEDLAENISELADAPF